MLSDYGRIAIGCRIASAPDPAFFESWTRLITAGLRSGDVVLPSAVGLPHAMAANFLVEQFLKTDCDSILFVDDDMSFDVEALEKLRGTKGVDIVAGLACCRRAPFNPVCLMNVDNGVAWRSDMAGVTECDTVWLAFTLIRRGVLEEIIERDGEVFAFRDSGGEDGHFCAAAKSLGYSVAVNTAVSIGHRVTFTVNWDLNSNQPDTTYRTFGIGMANERKMT